MLLNFPSLISDVRTLRNQLVNNQANLTKDPGVYCWWFDKDGMDKILKPIVNFGLDKTKIATKPISGKKYYALYFGKAQKESVISRLKWHICQKHSKSAVSHGYLSTLRATLSALLQLDKSQSEANVNDFMNKHCVVEWWYLEQPKIESVEKCIISNGYFPLNIQINPSIPLAVKEELIKLRKSYNK